MHTDWCLCLIMSIGCKGLAVCKVAVAAVDSRSSNSRWRAHRSPSGLSATPPSATGIKGTADISGMASVITRSPAGQEDALWGSPEPKQTESECLLPFGSTGRNRPDADLHALPSKQSVSPWALDLVSMCCLATQTAWSSGHGPSQSVAYPAVCAPDPAAWRT